MKINKVNVNNVFPNSSKCTQKRKGFNEFFPSFTVFENMLFKFTSCLMLFKQKSLTFAKKLSQFALS